MSDSEIDDRTTVLALLKMSGLSPAPDEVDLMVAGFAPSRAAMSALYTMPGVRYEEPAVTFDPRV